MPSRDENLVLDREIGVGNDVIFRCSAGASSRSADRQENALTVMLISPFTRSFPLALYASARAFVAVLIGVVATMFYRGSRQDVYNILWSVVFGFATLNILSLAARRVEPGRRGLNFGELMAVGVVLLSVLLLGWELLNLFHVFPIRLKR